MSNGDLDRFFGADGLKYKRDAILGNVRKFIKHLTLDELHRFTREMDDLITSYQKSKANAPAVQGRMPPVTNEGTGS